MVVLSFFLGIGVVLYVAELFYFPPLPIPGAKLGLANVVTLILIGLYGWREPLSNSVGRTLVGALVTGTFLTPPFFFSLTGASVSFLLMYAVYKRFYGKLSFVGVSVAGAVAHNLSQLLLARIFIGHWGVLVQTPLLILVAIPTGIFNGVIANYLLRRLSSAGWSSISA